MPVSIIAPILVGVATRLGTPALGCAVLQDRGKGVFRGFAAGGIYGGNGGVDEVKKDGKRLVGVSGGAAGILGSEAQGEPSGTGDRAQVVGELDEKVAQATSTGPSQR